MSTQVLVVDNHDSFVHTLIGYLRELGASVDVIEADAVDTAELPGILSGYAGVLLSPGPGRPRDAGAAVEVAALCARLRMPLLGVCLGHQAIGAAFGTEVSEASELMHGMVSRIDHDGAGVFAGIPSPVEVGRYHSLALAEDELPAPLAVTARTASGTVMAIEHSDLPITGVQFHPESVLTEHGYRMLANWLATIGSAEAVERAAHLHPVRPAAGHSPVQ